MTRRPWASPLVPLYAAGLAWRQRGYALGRGVHTLTRPVVSVGSLSAGGAGKTPVVLALAKLLGAHGIAADVLSRGYGRRARTVERVDPAGTAARFGDEPLELAQAGLAVYVGGDRFAAGQLAERAGDAHLHLLDDGMQHRRLDRALELVLVTAEDVNDTLLPAGNLREPFRALSRAHAVVVRAEEASGIERAVRSHTDAPVWIVARHLRLPGGFPAAPYAFCALARPQTFFAMLRQAGVAVAGERAFRDHHPYGYRDIASLLAAAQRADADGFTTTAKDAVKLTPAMRARLERLGPLVPVELAVSFTEEAAVLARCVALLQPPSHARDT